MPAICKNASVQLAATGWLFQPSFIPYEMAAVALERLDKDCPLMASADKQTYIVMSRSYWASHPKTKLTVPLMKEYRDSLKGKLAPRIKRRRRVSSVPASTPSGATCATKGGRTRAGGATARDSCNVASAAVSSWCSTSAAASTCEYS